MDNNNIVIILHIAEATGLCCRNDGIRLSAMLGGNSLVTECLPADNHITFNSNLIWETDKESLKKMKADNLPIKLECYSITNIKGTKELIGFIIFQIRNIPIINGNKLDNIKNRWYKIVGLSGLWQMKKPEILICLTITNLENLKTIESFHRRNRHVQQVVASKSSPDKTINSHSNFTDQTNELIANYSASNQILIDPQLISLDSQRSLIQIGNSNDDIHQFTAEIHLKNANFLKNIVDLNQFRKLSVKYIVGDGTCNTKSNSCNLQLIQINQLEDSVHLIGETFRVNFRTSLRSLRIYFDNQFSVTVEFYQNDEIFGHSELNFATALPATDTLTEFICDTKENNLKKCLKFSIIPLNRTTATDLQQPNLETEFCLSYVPNKNDANNQQEIINPKLSNCDDDAKYTAMSNDLSNQAQISDENSINIGWSEIKTVLEESPVTSPIRVNDTLSLESIKATSKLDKKPPPHTYSYSLTIENLKFNKNIEAGIWQISLYHPKAHNPMSIVNVVHNESSSSVFQNIDINLYFSSEMDQIINTIESESLIINVKGPRQTYATATLDNRTLLAQEKSSGIILLENECCDKVAMINAYVQLTDLGTNFNNQQSQSARSANNNRNYLLDEDLVYKVVEELEDWKLKQQTAFMAELKAKESDYLAKLANDWQQRKNSQEIDLAEKMRKCEVLTTALIEAKETIKEKNLDDISRQRIYDTAKLELEKTFDSKLMHVKVQTRTIIDSTLNKLKLAELKIRESEIANCHLNEDNEKLRKIIFKLEEDCCDHKNVHSKSQTHLEAVLQELESVKQQLCKVEKSKLFYKEHWAQVLREVSKEKLQCQQMKSSASPSFRNYIDDGGGDRDHFSSNSNQHHHHQLFIDFIEMKNLIWIEKKMN